MTSDKYYYEGSRVSSVKTSGLHPGGRGSKPRGATKDAIKADVRGVVESVLSAVGPLSGPTLRMILKDVLGEIYVSTEISAAVTSLRDDGRFVITGDWRIEWNK